MLKATTAAFLHYFRSGFRDDLYDLLLVEGFLAAGTSFTLCMQSGVAF